MSVCVSSRVQRSGFTWFYIKPTPTRGHNRLSPGAMPVASESDQKDCEWVVERCKSHLKNNDRDSAKAWIITARSLFPDNFAVQV